MRWYKKHPHILKKESTELSSDGNYKEAWQKKHNLFLSAGEIIIRREKNYYRPVLFAYSEATPYLLPVVFLLKRVPDDMEGEILSKCNSVSDVAQRIQENIEFYYFRHQNSDGSLCLLDADNLGDDNAAFFSASQVIERVRDWFQCLLTNTFPPELPQVEAYAHSPHKVDDVEILYPETFLSDDIDNGEFYASTIVRIPNGHDSVKHIYWGTLLDGKSKNGLQCLPIGFRTSLHLLPDSIKDPVDLLTRQNVVENAINKKEMIKGFWWSISEEPKPFKNFDDLAFALSPNNKDTGYDLLFKAIGKKIKLLEDAIYIGLRFNNRQKNYEWLFIQLRKTATNAAALIGEISKTEFISNLENYQIYAVFSEPLTEDHFHKRNKGRADRNKLKSQKASIIGCGALGSEIADCLCKAGIGSLFLVDKQLFKAHNSIRHILGIDKMGLPKTYGLYDQLRLHNPFVKIDWENGLANILQIDINRYLPDDFIGVSSIADDNIEGYLNEQAVINNKTLFYTRVLRGGKAARIFRVIPGRDACKNCLALYRKDNSSGYPDIPEDKLLPTIMNECNNPIRPASAADIKNTAALTTRIILDYLNNPDNDTNHWVWTTEKGICIPEQSSYMFALIPFQFKPHPKCPYCTKEQNLTIYIPKSLAGSMQAEIEKNNSIETGGVLAGFYSDTRKIQITHVSGPGPKAIMEATRFYKDVKYCQDFLNKIYNETAGKSVYAGEWHFHPSKNNNPSNIDLMSLSEISNQNKYLLDEPIMIIFSNEGKLSCTAHPASRSYYKTECIIERDI